jgi:hypothetical protein
MDDPIYGSLIGKCEYSFASQSATTLPVLHLHVHISFFFLFCTASFGYMIITLIGLAFVVKNSFTELCSVMSSLAIFTTTYEHSHR